MRRKLIVSVCALALISAMAGQVGTASAGPIDPTDATKVPHYFGPWPNWALSPTADPDAVVTITGNGTGASALATVGANGAITAITVTDGGSGYSQAAVQITGSGTGATAKATIVKKGAIVDIQVTAGGTGYTAPVVSFTGGGAGTGAAATAYGAVEQVMVTDGGSGYTFPTVDFDLPDGPGGVQARGHAEMDANGTITGVLVDQPGSGYSTAPGVSILNGTAFDPIPGNTPAAATTTLSISQVVIDNPGTGYTQTPTVVITDPTGTDAAATAALDNGVVSAITVTKPGSGYISPGGIRKFVDGLPGLGPQGANNMGKYISVAQPDTTTFPGADYYVIGLVQTTEQFSSSLPSTLVREYVQLSTTAVPGKHVALATSKLGGGTVPTLMPDGTQAYAVDDPQWLGPTIVAQKDRPVRVTFYNLLPTGDEGDLFLPVDSTIMGSGPAGMNEPFDPVPTTGGTVMDAARNPAATDARSQGDTFFLKNRATLHLHGGNTPWISDGTPHQWITPANDTTNWPKGVSVKNVPDMPDPGPGGQTFYYTNQQSARLMFYHDHSWGITRLNVYAGEAAGYVITDATEQRLFGPNGTYKDMGEGLPLVIQDRTFVPRDEQLYDTANSYGQDPTWVKNRWGGYGNFWYHHVYMPAQNPNDPSGMSAYGRWMYGPWFWPPAGDAKYGPIDNPYFDPNADPNDPATWQYQTDPYVEPPLIPGTPNISAGMEQFNDTPIVNGVAYPTVTVSPKAYRLRLLNAANDRFWNLQWYVADSTGTEVALKQSELDAAQLDPTVFPTPDLTKSPAGPDWIQIGTEGGFLPHPVVVDGQQVTTWITDPTRFDVGNVDKHSMLLAPAERADTIVDFSAFRGKTLILYNDAPAAFPARVPSYDYYTGAPDQSPVGAAQVLPGYGPNTRTIMQVKVANTAAARTFNLTGLKNLFSHKANGTGVFEEGQHPIIVGQAQYNSAYGTDFVASGLAPSPQSTNRADGFVRINQQGGDEFTFDTLSGKKVSLPLQPKAIHDEMNASNFDEYGRMQANLGVEVVPATPGLQNVVLHPYVFSPTEVIDASGLPVADVTVKPISTGDFVNGIPNTPDGTQLWKITHNGVDTHPIHFHGYDVQVLNRVTWDNIIIPPDETELGWKDTVRISPLEDTIVALRPVVPKLPWDVPNSVRLISPMMADKAELALSSVAGQNGVGMTAFAPNGDPIDVYNHYANFGAEYVYHCHILSHEEMDMMRPVLLAYPPTKPSAPTIDASGLVSWTDNSYSETQFVVQMSTDGGASWTDVGTVPTLFKDGIAGASAGKVFPELLPGYNTSDGTYTFQLTTLPVADEMYRISAQNVVGDAWDYSDPNLNGIVSGGFPTVTVKAHGAPFTIPAP